MKKKGIVIGKEFKELDGRVFKDEKAVEARLDVSTKIRRRKSNRVRFGQKNPCPKDG